jgi:hypothetical protein
MTLATTLVGFGPAATAAQTELTVELGASQIGPAEGAGGGGARYGVGGLRFSSWGLSGSGVTASLMFGTAFGEPRGGDFVSGVLGASLRDRWSSTWSGGFDTQLVGFEIRSPYPYRTYAVEGGPSVTAQGSVASLTAAGVLGVGRSRVELWRRVDGIHLVFEDDLWRVGATVEALLGPGPVRGGVTGGVHHTAGGGYASIGSRILVAGGWGAVELRGDIWSTPVGTDYTGGLALAIPLSAVSVRGFLGRSEPDPLTLTEAASGSGGIVFGVNVFSSEVGAEESADDVWAVVSRGGTGARVRLSFEAPPSARRVALLGDFTLWEPVALHRQGRRWTVELDVPEGTYHYGFLVDDEWYLPDGLRDVVPDEWGRESAILVIEGVS